MTGKLDPETVGSPRTVEVVVRGNPIAEANKADDAEVANGGTGAAVAMDETQ